MLRKFKNYHRTDQDLCVHIFTKEQVVKHVVNNFYLAVLRTCNTKNDNKNVKLLALKKTVKKY